MMQVGTCKHYNGAYHNTHCSAGVCYRDVTTDPDSQAGSALRIACHRLPIGEMSASQQEHFDRRGKCDKYEDPTADEIKADEAFFEAAIARMEKTFPLIDKVKQEHKGKDWNGVETCPECGGKLHMSHSSYNGHVWGKCETENCLSWME